MQSKTCKKCKETKVVSEFNKDKRAKDGLQFRCKACQSNVNAEWYSENKEHADEVSARWYCENKEHRAESISRWAKANPEKRRAAKAKRRANKFDACTPTTCHKTITLFELHKPEGYHLDHKVPLNKGGSHHQDNLMYVPANLNLRKSDKLLSEHPKLEAEYNQEAISPFKFI